ncbi:MobF family relaxase [Propionicicella superfundia]|uniref:MobF family relaxase n=1 Tax=Propionicicella superfundia TaxID=348582 RepID=UPI000407DFEA|nr:MobF family relaxase [Propionicicella superfundia]
MSLHKITAGSGYDYLTRQVAVQDSTEKGHTGLASYYTQSGETPGVWLGSGMAGVDGLDAGDLVTAEQMQNLFGTGMHPLAQQRMDALHGPGLTEADYREASRLGSPFKIHTSDVSPFRVEVAKRFAALNLLEGAPSRSAVAASERARIRTEVGREFFRAEFGREPADARELAGLIAKLSRPQTTAIAGFDLTFSPVKSVSTLWALADPHMAATIERCHQAAIADSLRFVETHALFTRTGAKGVRQVNVRGLVAAAFTHRDSRAGDPDLHTHVAVANKVQTHDGRWLSIDGRVLFKAKVTASETYNTALERHLADALGVQFIDRATSAGRRPVREIDGVDPALNTRWSARRRSIEARRDELAVEFQATHGRPPTPIETLGLAQQANLETREAKHEPRTLAEQRTAWRTQAEAVLGGQDGVRRMIHTALHPGRIAGPVLDDAWFTTTAASIVGTVESSRATWQSWHLRAEAQRRARAANVPTANLEAAVERLVATALSDHSLPLAVATDGITEPAALQRVDGQSVYTVAGAELFTSPRILAAEQRLVEAAGRSDGKVVDPATVDLALLETAANGVELNAGQVALVRAMACSGARVQVAIAPAGSGKTTAMRALARAWSDAGGTVLGLAPSAAAAAALGDQIDTHTDTLAKLTWSIEHNDLPDWAAQIGPTTLVVIDEAGMADTLSLDAAVGHILAAGASVRLVGDDQQLAAIGAGGVLRDIATRHGAARLNELVRFADPAEGGASLALRDGNPEALGFYLDHGRVHVGDLATMTDAVFDAWQTEEAAGLDTIMLAPTRDLVAELNTRARSHRLAGTLPGGEVELADGLSASVGDVIITRTNDRRLRVSATDWVKNGDRWTITAINDGGVRALHTRSRRSVVLPADYVASSVELGYASTVHTAQGVSVDTMHGLATGTEGRQQLYTMLTRGRHANHVYLQVVGDGDPHSVIRPDTIHPLTATDVLEQILARDTAPTSATSLQQQLVDPRVRLGEAVARYTDALSAAAEDLAGDLAVRALERQVDRALPGVPWCDAWPALRAHLLLIAADGHDPLAELRRAAAEQPLTGAGDPAAVLDWRLDATGLRGSQPGPLPWIPAVPSRLRDHSAWGPYLDARARLVVELADAVHLQAITTGRTPAWLASTLGQLTGQTIADLTVWRAAMGVPEADLRPTGDRQFPKAAARWQRHLERRLTGDRQPALAEWCPLLRRLEPRLAGDNFTPTLAARLAQLSASGLNARTLLRTAAGEGNLPDDHPAAALWWRIARHLTPAVTAALDTDQPLTTAWTTTLAEAVGTERAAELQASRWWPALVTAVDHGVRQGWTPADLLGVGASEDDQVDECLALVWRISTLTDPPHPVDDEPEPPHPADEPPADLWNGFQPTHPVIIGDPAEGDEPVAVDPIDDRPWDADEDDLDGGAGLALQAMIRDTLGPPEPTDQDIRKMFERADAWRDCPSTPERLAEINRLTAAFYQDRLPGSWAQPYLESRFGVDLTGHPDLQPGYAPAGWNTLVAHLHRLGVRDEEMLAVGVATRASTGRLIDRFRDRAVFPIRHDGVILGFVGRRHPDRTEDDKAGPKYLNTGDTPLFHKGDQLYTTGPLVPGVTPVIVEGPMDAIAVTLATGGKYMGVAPLGTSLTDEQAAQLRQLGYRTPIVATDADLAGRVAAERDYWILTPCGHDPRYAVLLDGTDPADLLATGRADALESALENASPLARRLIDERCSHLPAGEAALDALRVIAAQPSQQWENGLQDLTDRLDIPECVLRLTLADLVNAWNDQPSAAAQVALRGLGDVKNRLLRQSDVSVLEHVPQPQAGAAKREPRIPIAQWQTSRRPSMDV